MSLIKYQYGIYDGDSFTPGNLRISQNVGIFECHLVTSTEARIYMRVSTARAVKTETSKKIRQKKGSFFFLIFSTCVAPVLFYK
jgi:hypothetical protein